MIPRDARDEFWGVVVACLREFHNTTPAQAHQFAADLRRKVDHPSDGSSPDLFYHAKPFDVACDLANRQFDVWAVLPRYLVLRDGGL